MIFHLDKEKLCCIQYDRLSYTLLAIFFCASFGLFGVEIVAGGDTSESGPWSV